MTATSMVRHRRRTLLVGATTLTGSAALTGTAVILIQSMGPSEAAKAAGAPVDVDLTAIAPNALLTVEWRGKPVWILHRSARMLALLDQHKEMLVDPLSRQDQQPPYAANATRSIRPDFMVMTALCTHLGCVPLYRPQDNADAAALGPQWAGGFYCPCHGSRFDLAGRVYKNVPAPRNLEVPPHRYLNERHLLIGADAAHAA
jgi:ubiquinol-cytochrome c reductase iron-sulfur subunit